MKFDKGVLDVEIKAYNYDLNGEDDYVIRTTIRKNESVKSFVYRIEEIIKELIKEEE